MAVRVRRIPLKVITLKYTEEVFRRIRDEMKKAIVGQDTVIELLMTTILSEGHAILEGVPGLAKTLIINSLARCLDLSFNRIQFTPDMVPSDITGTEVILPSAKNEKEFRFIKGPVFSNIILADEINRTPPKTQSALLQSMQERQVTVLGNTYDLPDPFIVLATQNPIEYEGTYPLPEAQLDRFLLFIRIDYPSYDEELTIIDASAENLKRIEPVVTIAELKRLTEESKALPVAEKVKRYALEIVRSTRPQTSQIESVKRYVEWGAGPRASQMLVRAAQAKAFLKQRALVTKEDIDEALLPVLKHRILLNYTANAEKIGVESLLIEIGKKAGLML